MANRWGQNGNSERLYFGGSRITAGGDQSILKEISPEYSMEGLMLKLKLQYFDHLMQRTDSLEKNLLANAGDVRDADSIPGLGRSPGEGNGNPLQYSCLENSMGRGAWCVIVCGVANTGHNGTQAHTHMNIITCALCLRRCPSPVCLLLGG